MRSTFSLRRAVMIAVLAAAVAVGAPTLARAQNGSLKLTSFPSGANVVVDGVDAGKGSWIPAPVRHSAPTPSAISPAMSWSRARCRTVARARPSRTRRADHASSARWAVTEAGPATSTPVEKWWGGAPRHASATLRIFGPSRAAWSSFRFKGRFAVVNALSDVRADGTRIVVGRDSHRNVVAWSCDSSREGGPMHVSKAVYHLS
jgi:hypothetical protein